MSFTFDESSFRSVWRNANETTQLRSRLHAVLQVRDVSSFDGLGHLLAAILPEDPANLGRIAETLHLSSRHLARLRNSELDPLALPLEAMALLGYVMGLAPEMTMQLMQRDHSRFAPMATGVTGRGPVTDSPEAILTGLRRVWERLEADDAKNL